MIWKSLLHFQEIENYEKVVFLTKDSDYNSNYSVEFKAKWYNHFTIVTDEKNFLIKVKKDCEHYIKERAINDYAQTDYLKANL